MTVGSLRMCLWRAAAAIASTARFAALAAICLVMQAARAETPAASPPPARRIVTLAPHLAELVEAAGGSGRLVGVIRYSDFPPEVRRVPVIGDAFSLNFEAIAALKPDLVLAWGSGTNERHKAQLRRMGLRVVDIEIGTVEGIAATLRQLGTLMATQPQADRAADELLASWAALRAQYAARRPIRVFWQLWHDPLMTVNGQHLVSAAITACGGTNVFAALPALTPTVSWEAAARANPEVIATAASPEEPADWGRWKDLPRVSAVAHDAFVKVDGNLITRMGPRFVQGAQALCEGIDKARSALPTAR